MDYQQITFEQRGRVGLITLNRPEKLNAWTDRMMGEYRDAIERANADPGIGAIVMTGSGRAFCAGADIGGFQAQIKGDADSPVSGRANREGGDWISFLNGMGKPTIAAINGAAVGIGITQVLPFDIRIASENARIGLFFVRMGLVPELASSHFLAQMAGYGRALEWCLTGRMLSAQEAKDGGLVTEVLPADQLLDRALALGEELSNQSPLALKLIKDLFRENATDGDLRRVQQREGQALAQAYASPEHHEAVAAFLEKRPANFARK
ncbi:MAG: enoyl-CoA hydratase/isomerase family protein [Chloroflexi bacterium]|nr:enoyl-CoA hydratase/isomerase family protein [Chloroflexota bacterium]